MVWVLVRHRIEDYDKWRPLFNGEGSLLRNATAKEGYVFRNLSDSHELLVFVAWETEEEARAFMEAEELRQVMKDAGVTDKPDIYYLEVLERAGLG